MSDTINILLYGLGAIGSFYAFILSRAKKVRLTVVARSNFDAVRANGILIKSQNHGEHRIHPDVVRSPDEAHAQFDYIVCAHKALDQAAVPMQLVTAVAEAKTTIVLIQNGVGIEEPFHKAFAKCAIISCVAWTGATQTSPGVVESTKSEDIQIGLFPNSSLDATSERQKLDTFASLLRDGGTSFRVEDHIQVHRWSKVVWNAAWNSLTTLTMLDTQSWLSSSSGSEPMTRRLMREVIDVAKAIDVPLQYELIDQLLKKIRAMPGIGSSMLTDCKNGRKMEVDVIFGVPVRKGRELGVPVPILETLYTILQGVNSRLG